jgi:hypothetical protein
VSRFLPGRAKDLSAPRYKKSGFTKTVSNIQTLLELDAILIKAISDLLD